MPMKPKRPCRHPGCPSLSDDVFCDVHRPLYARESAVARGYDRRWQAARKRFLRMFPLCNECKKAGRLVSATVVDHIIPHRGDEQLFWDKANFQSLCKPCHDKKTGAGL